MTTPIAETIIGYSPLGNPPNQPIRVWFEQLDDGRYRVGTRYPGALAWGQDFDDYEKAQAYYEEMARVG